MEKNPNPVLISHLNDKERTALITKEFEDGFKFAQSYNKSVTFFGSARSTPDDELYKKAEDLAKRIVKELDYVVVTGGGPGIMEAGNKGAYNAGGRSLGFTIELPKEQHTNKFLTGAVDFNFFFSRKSLMAFAAETYLFFPGGFGTFDELFEVLTLVQTGKIERVPIVLVGKDFWSPLDEFIKREMVEKHKTVDLEDTKLYTITDDEDEILEIIKNAPIRN